jgi:hypothetical protein
LRLFSLKGCNNSAQGNALGKGVVACFDALKGRNNLLAENLLRPFRAGDWCGLGPRALPRAVLLQPFRLKSGWPVART